MCLLFPKQSTIFTKECEDTVLVFPNDNQNTDEVRL